MHENELKAAKHIGLGIAVAAIAASAAWLEMSGDSAGGLWLLVVIVVIFGF